MINVPRGHESIDIPLPPEVNVERWSVDPSDFPEVPGRKDLRSEIEQVLASGLRSVGKKKIRMALAIPDQTRNARQSKIVRAVWQVLDAREGTSSCFLDILVATGRHDPPSRDQLDAMVPPFIRNQSPVNVEIHDCRSDETLRKAGSLPDGTPLVLNERAVTADVLLLAGLVRPHYLAGFGGGAKTLCPGLAGEDLIQSTHCQSVCVAGEGAGRREGTGPGQFRHNPMQDRIQTIFREADTGRTSGIQIVVGPQGEMRAVEAGDVLSSHRRARTVCRDLFQQTCTLSGDILVLSPGGHPHDLDLIQSHKALQNTRDVLSAFERIVFVAGCSDGYGHPEMKDWLDRGRSSDLAGDLGDHFAVYGQTAMALKELIEEHSIHFLTSLPSDELRARGFNVLDDAGDVASLLPASGKKHQQETVCLIPEAAEYVLVPEEKG